MGGQNRKRNQLPSPSNLKASADWLRLEFAGKGRAKSALKQVNLCLDEISSYEHHFLLAKANCLGYLEKWDELANLLQCLITLYPRDPEVLCHHAQFHMAHGRWQKALQFLRSAEKGLELGESPPFVEGLYDEKIECLVGMNNLAVAKREAKRVLKKYPTFSIIRARIDSLESGTYQKPIPWA